jgi:hypothetical protein
MGVVAAARLWTLSHETESLDMAVMRRRVLWVAVDEGMRA